MSPGELLELVDDHGVTIGTALRSSCHGDPSLRYKAVHVLVCNSVGGLFLQKCATTKDIHPGMWDTSVGGHVARGENYREAAVRELHEDLGIRVHAADLYFAHRSRWRTEVETEQIGTFTLTHDGPFELHPTESGEGRFWTAEELEAAGSDEMTLGLLAELEP